MGQKTSLSLSMLKISVPRAFKVAISRNIFQFWQRHKNCPQSFVSIKHDSHDFRRKG